MELNRWKNFTKREQLMMIGAELMRAKLWQSKDGEKFISALGRALELISLALSDDKWRDGLLMMLRLREEIAKFYISKRTDDISVLYNAL